MSTLLAENIWAHWLPRPKVRSWDWICQHVHSHTGQKFDPENVPWLEGFCDAFDDPQYREYALQWATRTAKTFGCLSLQLAVWCNNPMPTIFASATEMVAVNIVREKIYRMIAHCPPLRGQLRPPSRRSVYHVDLAASTCRVAWSGSEASLADFSAWLAHANELDKWDTSKSDEGDPVELLLERIKEFPDSKALLEGTPTEEGKSRIERRRLLGTDSRFWVPCQRCGAYQVLEFGNDEPGEKGVIYDAPPDGSSDPDMAYATARYRCCACGGENHDEDRARMIRAGRWAAAGQHVDKKGRVVGTPQRPATRVWSSQLSSMYSLQLRWGDIAAKWVRVFRRPKERQNFVNSWLGLTVSASLAATRPEELGARLATDTPQGIVPPGVAFLTCGIDRQIDHRVYVVCGWGSEERGYLIDYGVVQTDQELWNEVLLREYPDASGTRHYPLAAALYDSGFETDDVYKFCQAHSTIERPILPCKGTDQALGGNPYKKSRLGDGRRRVMRKAALSSMGQLLVFMQNDYWQRVLQRYFDEARPGEPSSLSLPAEARHDLELAEQLLNASREPSIDSRGRRRIVWKTRDADAADDFRDALKMARVMAELYLRGRWGRVPAMLPRAGRRIDRPAPPPASEQRAQEQRRQASRFVRPLSGRRRRGGQEE